MYGVGSSEEASTKRVGGRNFVAAVLGMHCDRKAPDGEEPVASLLGRRRLDRPFDYPVALDQFVAVTFCVDHEHSQQNPLCPKAEA